ncbi:aminoacyltransferase [Allobaculum sp. Allo2]|nr:aminoacyltransferase [Allobaculum sp. Allo2]
MQSSPLCNLLQSYNWAAVKSNWDHLHCGLYKNDTLCATALVLIKALPFGFTMMYIPRGPILDYDDPEVIKQFFDGLKKSDAAIKRCLSKWIRALKSESIRLPIRPDQETATKNTCSRSKTPARFSRATP